MSGFASKFIFPFVVIIFISVGAQAQAKPTSVGDYNGTFMYAVSETNHAYPVIFKVEIDVFEKGKSVRKSIETVENESELHHRSTKMIVEDGKTIEIHEILMGSGNGFCKEGNGGWRRSTYVCPEPGGLLVLRGSREAESVKYSVEDKKIRGKTVKVYRKYSVFSDGDRKGAKKTYEEEVATIDSNGYFVSVVTTEGMLEPVVVKRIMKESWVPKAKIEPIVAPIK